jgi:hypothetical protein
MAPRGPSCIATSYYIVSLGKAHPLLLYQYRWFLGAVLSSWTHLPKKELSTSLLYFWNGLDKIQLEAHSVSWGSTLYESQSEA